jgi:hypothetical protein
MLSPLTYIHVGNVDIEYPLTTFAPIGQDVPVPRSTGMCESGQVIAMDGMYAGFAGAKTGYCHGWHVCRFCRSKNRLLRR